MPWFPVSIARVLLAHVGFMAAGRSGACARGRAGPSVGGRLAATARVGLLWNAGDGEACMAEEFQEIGHSGGKITFTVVTDESGHRTYQVGISSTRYELELEA